MIVQMQMDVLMIVHILKKVTIVVQSYIKYLHVLDVMDIVVNAM